MPSTLPISAKLSLEPVQVDHHALWLRQALERDPHALGPLMGEDDVCRIVPPLWIHEHVVVALRLGAPLPSQPVDAYATCDGEDPRPEPLPCPPPPASAVQLQERGLQEILRDGAVPHGSHEERVDRRRERTEQPLERFGVSPYVGLHEGLLVHLSPSTQGEDPRLRRRRVTGAPVARTRSVPGTLVTERTAGVST